MSFMSFLFVCNSISVTVGPPKNISVTPGKGSLTLHFSPPFDVVKEAVFEYRVRYWEKAGAQQARTLLFFVWAFFSLEFLTQKKGFARDSGDQGPPSLLELET